jgi:2,4-dienoyl-CoA reductase-like NADH-dependent reductase (Old Yellow Enzyme family)
MGTNGARQLRMDNDQYISGLWNFNERMHAYGAATSVQLNHAGASAYGLRLEGKDCPFYWEHPKPKLADFLPNAGHKQKHQHD